MPVLRALQPASRAARPIRGFHYTSYMYSAHRAPQRVPAAVAKGARGGGKTLMRPQCGMQPTLLLSSTRARDRETAARLSIHTCVKMWSQKRPVSCLMRIWSILVIA